jgi:hypothetical protein
MRQLEEALLASSGLISKARASLECDKKLLQTSINLISRSYMLLKQVSAAMEVQEWLEAQIAGTEENQMDST